MGEILLKGHKKVKGLSVCEKGSKQYIITNKYIAHV
jgi:hypothetical protein